MTPEQLAHAKALEDAAKALCRYWVDTHLIAIDREEYFEQYWRDYLPEARLADEAMRASLLSFGYKVTPREPTEEMIFATLSKFGIDQHARSLGTDMKTRSAYENRIIEYQQAWDTFSWPPKEE